MSDYFSPEMSSYEVGDRITFVNGSDLHGTNGTIIEVDPESDGMAFLIQSDLKCCPVFATVLEITPA